MRGGRGDSFGESDCFLGIGQLFFVGKAITCGTFNPKLHTIRFAGLPFVFTSGEGWRTDAAKLGRIRFVKITCFSQIQMLFSYVGWPIKLLRYVRFVSSSAICLCELCNAAERCTVAVSKRSCTTLFR